MPPLWSRPHTQGGGPRAVPTPHWCSGAASSGASARPAPLSLLLCRRGDRQPPDRQPLTHISQLPGAGAGMNLRPHPPQGQSAVPAHTLPLRGPHLEASPRHFAASSLGVPWLLRNEARRTLGSLQPPELCPKPSALSLSVEKQVLTSFLHLRFWNGHHQAHAHPLLP